MGLKWQLEVQSRPQKAAEGLCSTSSPTFPPRRYHLHHHCHLGGSLSQPETSQPTTLAFAKVPMHLWMLPGLACSPSGTCPGAKATWAEEIPEAESCWCPH